MKLNSTIIASRSNAIAAILRDGFCKKHRGQNRRTRFASVHEIRWGHEKSAKGQELKLPTRTIMWWRNREREEGAWSRSSVDVIHSSAARCVFFSFERAANDRSVHTEIVNHRVLHVRRTRQRGGYTRFFILSFNLRFFSPSATFHSDSRARAAPY